MSLAPAARSMQRHPSNHQGGSEGQSFAAFLPELDSAQDYQSLIDPTPTRTTVNDSMPRLTQTTVTHNTLNDPEGVSAMPRLCSLCHGHGVLPRVARGIPGTESQMTLLVRCEPCEGHGVVLHGEDRDFARS